MKISLRELRSGLGALDLDGVRTYDTIPAGPAQLPALVVGWPRKLDLTDGTLAGATVTTIPLTMVVSLGSDATHAQRRLDELIDGSLQTALDLTDNPVWRWAHVTTVEAFRTLTIGESTPALAADFILEILA